MSGGYYNYKYYEFDEYIEDIRPYDPVVATIMEDIKNICHDLEWCKSGDTSDEDLMRSLDVFKRRWIKATPEVQLTVKEAILDYCDKVDEYCTKLREGLLNEKK